MARVTLILLALFAVGLLLAFASQPASAQETSQPPARTGEYPNVASLQPFTAAADYMSVPGFLRWQTFQEQGIWISYAEARRIVIAQGGQLYHRA